jgi:ribosomal small subunit protein bTHX
MGRGDQRTRKGKIFAGSYGKTRKRGKRKPAQTEAVEKPAPKTRKKADQQ